MNHLEKITLEFALALCTKKERMSDGRKITKQCCICDNLVDGKDEPIPLTQNQKDVLYDYNLIM